MKGIAISTWIGGEEPLTILLDSLRGVQYPLYIHINGVPIPDLPHWKCFEWHPDALISYNEKDNYELGAIHGVYESTEWTEFFFMQDTMKIKNLDLFRIMFEEYHGKSIQYGHRFQMYLGKFRREILDFIKWPSMPETKWDALVQETEFTQAYLALDPQTVEFNPQFSDFIGVPQERYGRLNLVLEDAYLIKWKGTFK